MKENARTWLTRNFLCTEGEPDRQVRTLTDCTEGFCMAPQTFICQDAEDNFWRGTADLEIPGLRILEDGEGTCMLQLPADPEAQAACLAALYAARCSCPVPVHLGNA